MKRWIFYVTIMMIIILGACNVENDLEKNIIMPTESLSVTRMPTPTEFPFSSKNQPDIPAGTEIVDWTELACYADEKTSLRNSNLLNEGYLTYDEKGNIYFVDMNIGGIFSCERDGKNRRQLSPQNASALQIEGDWLYFAAEGVKRIHILTGEEQVIYDQDCGETVIKDNRIYVNSPEGFISMELDGSNKKILRDQSLTLASYTMAENTWLGIAYEGENVEYFLEGHLYAYDEANKKTISIMEGCWYPLLAGNWLSTFGSLTGKRYVWDLETDERFDLNIYAQKVVSNGENLYYVRVENGVTIVYRWNGGEAEEIWHVQDANQCNFLYLTPDALYILPKISVGGKTVTQLLYYDLETSGTGQVY